MSKKRKGRPSKYETEWKNKLEIIGGWAKDGLVDAQIANNMGVSRSTLSDWKTKYPELLDTLNKNKEIVDREVENALLKRALGYSYEETTKELVKNPLTEEVRLETEEVRLEVTKVVTKQVSPDTTAQIFWLKNRKPNEWRDKKDVGVTFDKNLEDFFGSDEE